MLCWVNGHFYSMTAVSWMEHKLIKGGGGGVGGAKRGRVCIVTLQLFGESWNGFLHLVVFSVW